MVCPKNINIRINVGMRFNGVKANCLVIMDPVRFNFIGSTISEITFKIGIKIIIPKNNLDITGDLKDSKKRRKIPSPVLESTRASITSILAMEISCEKSIIISRISEAKKEIAVIINE
ncbi:MAG: hypothetical protein J7K59_05800 [Candidatus Korarchaeota archaeon]|nr:hypothetical protein [Candidatus Korarchaeota archaeon]